jgi:ATP-dependent 26S proteasome regulatory subunit|tara:strand:- start:5826 stop:6305 length:480 start_codon:yes stop_codon:yes gene_type:complete
MNAKDTLKAIAEALNIVSGDAKEVTPEVAPEVATVATDETTEVAEVAPEVVEDETTEVATEVAEVAEVAPEVTPEAVEAAPEVDNSRVNELEKQLSDLKEILKNAMTQPEVIEAPIVEAPEPKGLTHSPEAPVAKKAASGVGRKGGSIQERVNRYINNN